MKTSVQLATILVCLVTPGIFKSNVLAKVVEHGQADMDLHKMAGYTDIIVNVLITLHDLTSSFFPILSVPRAEDSCEEEQEELVGGVQEGGGDDLQTSTIRAIHKLSLQAHFEKAGSGRQILTN